MCMLRSSSRARWIRSHGRWHAHEWGYCDSPNEPSSDAQALSRRGLHLVLWFIPFHRTLCDRFSRAEISICSCVRYCHPKRTRTRMCLSPLVGTPGVHSLSDPVRSISRGQIKSNFRSIINRTWASMSIIKMYHSCTSGEALGCQVRIRTDSECGWAWTQWLESTDGILQPILCRLCYTFFPYIYIYAVEIESSISWPMPSGLPWQRVVEFPVSIAHMAREVTKLGGACLEDDCSMRVETRTWHRAGVGWDGPTLAHEVLF